MFNKRHVFFILFVLIFTIGAISSASASDMSVVGEDLSSCDDCINVEESNEIINDVADDSTLSEGVLDDSNENPPNEIVEAPNENNIDDEIIDDSLSSAGDEASLKYYNPVDENVIYFDAYASKDGNGSMGNPYKYLDANRIAPGVTAHFANGTYHLNSSCIFEGVKMIGDGDSVINSKVSNQYDFIIKENSTLEMYNLMLQNIQILNQGTFIAEGVLFEGNDVFNMYDSPEIEFVSGQFNKSIGAVIVCDTPSDISTALVLNYCGFEKNYGGLNGGAIAAVNSNITIANSRFQHYASTYKGGAIYCLDSILNINHSTFEPKTTPDESVDFTIDNYYTYTSYYGGSIFCENSSAIIYNTSFIGSLSYSFGGCIASVNSNMTIDLTEFNNSQSLSDGGGAIYNSKGELYINCSAFNNNSGEFGGAICNLNSILDSDHCQYCNNSAKYFGGVIYDIYGTLNLNYNNFDNCSALFGGSIYTRIPNDFNLYNNSFYNSYAKEGLSIFFDGKGENIAPNFISGDNSIDYGELIVPINSTGLEMHNTYGNEYHVFVEFAATLNGEHYSLISNPLYYQVSPKNTSEIYENASTYLVSDGLVSIIINDLEDFNQTAIVSDNVLRNISANVLFNDEFSNPILNFYLCSNVNFDLYNGDSPWTNYLFSGTIDDLNLDKCLIQNYSIDLSNEALNNNYNLTELCSINFKNPFLNIKYNNLYEASSFTPVSLVNYTINSSSSYSSSGSSSTSSGSDPHPSTSSGEYSSSYNSNLVYSYINLDEIDSVSPVKNQGNGGNCWAFAGLATLEACLKKATGITFDFSEENAKNLMAAYSVYGLKIETNYGGYDSMLMSYLTSWLGPIDESIEDYDDYSSISVQSNPMFHIQNIKFLPKRTNSSDNDLYKEAIRDNGAVSVTIKWGKDYHAVSLVGWDDDYEGYDALGKYAHGAWIFKNSWGSNWGYNGFGYLSYEEKISEQIFDYMHAYTFVFTDTNPYTKIYQYDFSGLSDFVPNDTVIYFKNVFIADNDSILSAFSTYFDRDTNFTAMVYKNDELVLTQEGFASAGYYTIPFNSIIELVKGDEFSIAVKNHNTGINSIPICLAEEITKKTFMQNVSFISFNGENWFDLYDYQNSCQVACIKAFTQSINLTSIRINVKPFSSIKTKNINIKVDIDYFDGIRSLNFCLVKFIVNNKTYYAQIRDGEASLNLNLEEGMNSIFVQYKDNVYESNIVQFNFTVSPNSNNQSFNALQDIINNAADKTIINLTRDYTYDEEFDNGLYGVFINKTLYINGNGHTINGLNKATAFLISANYVVLYNITFKNTVSINGGAVYICSRNVRINHCNFANSKASQNGGAIYSLFNISINNCRFTNNYANMGGGAYIINDGITSINNSCFNNNEGGYQGSAVYIIGSGTSIFSYSSFDGNGYTNCGGVVVSNVYLNNFTNCNFTNNYAMYGAGAYSNGYLSEFHKCIFSNNRAMTAGGAITAHNHINVYDSEFTKNEEILNIEELVDDGDEGFYFNSFGGGAIYSFDELNVYNSSFIKNNGTMGGAIYASKYLNIHKSKFITNSAKEDGGAVFGSYWEMITYNTALLKYGEPYLYDSIFINNSAGKSGGAIYSLDNLTVHNCSFMNNSAKNGGAIVNVDLAKNCTFINNSASEIGGAIVYADLVDNCTFINNSAGENGGAVANGKNEAIANLTFVYNSNFISNTAEYGGGIFSEDNMDIYNSTFIKNPASYGGAVYSRGNMSIFSSGFENNSASYGGAIISEMNMNIYNSSFIKNRAYRYGGAIHSIGNISTYNSSFINNSANYGGALYSMANININNSSFFNNSAYCGGAICSEYDMDVCCSTFESNSADYGGAVYCRNKSKILDSNFTKNSATYGGAILLDGDDFRNTTLNISSCSFTKNSAEYSGGAICSQGECIIADSSFDYNYAPWSSAFYSIYHLNITGSSFKSNPNDYLIAFTYYYDESNAAYGDIYVKNNVMDIENGIAIFYNENEIPYCSPLYLVFNNVTAIKGEPIILCQLEDDEGNSIYTYGMDTLSITLTNLNNNEMINLNLIFNETLGSYALKVPSIDIGNYKISGSFTNNFPYDYSVKEGTLNVIIKSIITSSGITKVYGKGDKLTITLKDEFENPMANVYLDISLNDKTSTVLTDENGQATLSVDLAPNTYTATVSFAGNETHSNASLAVKVIIKKATPAITASKKTFKIYVKSKSYTIILKDNLGRAMKNVQVKIILNGKTYSAYTNSEGKASFKLTNQFKKGTFKATITYAGNAYYTSASTTAQITIIKASPKIVASKKTFKAKAKTKKYTITLKDDLGKAMKKAKVKIKVKGKTYTAKTNSKGKATFKLKKLTKKGNLKATITYAGNAYYNAASKKVKITIKK